MKHFFVIAFGCFFSMSLFSQQDPLFSQYMFNHLSINPAYAGTRDALNMAVISRNQWVAMNGSPKTNVFTAQGPLKSKRIGLGLQLFSDKIGPKNITGALLSYSYQLPLFSGKLAMGLRMGTNTFAINWDEISFKDQTDPYAAYSGYENKTVLTADFGGYYYTKKFYWGIAANHLNGADYSDSADAQRMQMHLFSPIGYGIVLNDNIVFNPSALLKYTPGAPVNFDMNFNFRFNNKFWFGVSYRNSYGFATIMNILINEKLRLGYSFDLGFNKIGTAGRASHELMLGYDLNIHKSKIIHPRYL